MSSCSNFKRKTTEGGEEEQLAKRSKGVESEQDLDLQKEIEITDVNTDCLEKIFKFLELGDLLNVRDTCKHFQAAADFAFGQRFSRKWIIINKIHISRKRLINIQPNFVELVDLKSMLQTIRHFGGLIKKLKLKGDDLENFPGQPIDCIFVAKSIRLLSFYIGYYCPAGSLIELTVEKRISLKLFREPFLTVEKVKISTLCFPRTQQEHNRNWFIKMFPNVQQLKYKSAFGRITDFECIVDHFPKLKHLDISYANTHCKNLHRVVPITDDECIANNANVLKSLSLNPQLTTLALSYITDIKILQMISEQQHQLEYLSFQYAPKQDANSDTVHFRSVKKFKICLCSPSQRPNLQPIEVGAAGNEMIKIPFSFERLEEFIIQTCFQYSDEFFNFIGKHQTITKLNLRSCGWPQFVLTDLNRTRLVAASPILNEINLPCHTLKFDEVVAFTTEFKHLRKFSFKLHLWDVKNTYKKLVNRLKNEWQTTVCSHGSYVTMKRSNPK